MAAYNTKYVTVMNEARGAIRHHMNKFDEINKLFKVANGPTYEKVLEPRQKKAVVGLIEITVHYTCHKQHDEAFKWGNFFTRFTKKFCPQFSKVDEASLRDALLTHSVDTVFEYAMNKPLDTNKIREVVKANKCVCGNYNKETLLHQWYLVNKEMMTQLKLDGGWTVKSFVEHVYLFLFEAFATIAETHVHNTIENNNNASTLPKNEEKKKQAEEEIDRNFENYKKDIQDMLVDFPKVTDYIGEDPQSLIVITVEVIEKSDDDLTFFGIVEQVCYVAVLNASGKRLVARTAVLDEKIRLGIVQSKKSLAKISNPKAKWMAILRALGKLWEDSPTVEVTINRFYVNVVTNIEEYLERSAKKRKLKESNDTNGANVAKIAKVLEVASIRNENKK